MNARPVLWELGELSECCKALMPRDSDAADLFSLIAEVVAHINDGTDPRGSLRSLRSAVYALSVHE